MKAQKKTGSKKKLYLLLIILAVISAAAIIFLALLFHKPHNYKPLDLSNSEEISVYLTHHLIPEFYNGLQLREPFDLVVTQEGINDVVARFKWPRQFGGVSFSSPMVFFADDAIILMGTVLMEGANFVVTITAKPAIDADELLNLNVDSVKIGAVDITPLAAVLAQKIYRQQYADKVIDEKDFRTKMTISLLDGQPFDPIFRIEDKKVRIGKISLEQKKLTVYFVPVLN